MAGKVKTWIWVLVAIVVVGGLCVVTMAGVGFYFFSKHIRTTVTTPANAGVEFEKIEAQFSGQKARIELDDRGHFLRSNPDRPVRTQLKTPDQLSVLAYDPDDERIVRVTIPFWLLRFKARGTVDFNNDSRLDIEDLKLSVEDLEHYGPTLIVDHKALNGDRVLVWSQ